MIRSAASSKIVSPGGDARFSFALAAGPYHLGMTIGLIVVAVVCAAAAAWLGVLWSAARAEAARARAEASSAAGELQRSEARRREDVESRDAMLRGQRAELEQAIAAREASRAELERWKADLAAERRLGAEREQRVREEQTRLANWVREREEALKAQFAELSGAALEQSSHRFIERAKEVFEAGKRDAAAEVEKRREAVDALVRPIAATLEQTRAKLDAIEAARVEQFARIGEQIGAMATGSAALREETSRLTRALSKPEVRGRYGEIQLRRVAELAGMVGYCDFDEQHTATTAEGALRPDMVVRLPNERVVLVDAKTNIAAYLEAIDARTDAERESCLDRFAGHVADQAKKLAAKGYRDAVPGSAEFVVMFVPGDQFIDAALSRRPDILERAAESGVILASPSTLIGLLRAVYVGWREQQIAERAEELFTLGKELHDRAANVFAMLTGLGNSLDQSVKRYNELVGSVEARLTPGLRRFEEVGAKSGKEIKELRVVESSVRQLSSGRGARGEAMEA